MIDGTWWPEPILDDDRDYDEDDNLDWQDESDDDSFCMGEDLETGYDYYHRSPESITHLSLM